VDFVRVFELLELPSSLRASWLSSTQRGLSYFRLADNFGKRERVYFLEEFVPGRASSYFHDSW